MWVRSSCRRSSRIRDHTGAGGSLLVVVCPAMVTPRHSPNSRPSRRTRVSVRPASNAESQIEPWFAPMRTDALAQRPERIRSSSTETQMRKKTPPKTQERGQASAQPQAGGLIAKEAKRSRRSAKDSYALDNRSHRTTAASVVRSDRARSRGLARNRAKLRIHCTPAVRPAACCGF